MKKQTTTIIRAALMILGIIFFMAMAFDIIPGNYAIFAGIVCFILAGTIGIFARKTE